MNIAELPHFLNYSCLPVGTMKKSKKLTAICYVSTVASDQLREAQTIF